MTFVTLEGFEAYAGSTLYDEIETRYDDEGGIENALENVAQRVLYFCIPNEPRCAQQRKAFCEAVYAQFAFEESARNQQMKGMPDGMTSFSVNGFSASFGHAIGDSVANVGLCREARARLVLAGLLSRGLRSSSNAYA